MEYTEKYNKFQWKRAIKLKVTIAELDKEYNIESRIRGEN